MRDGQPIEQFADINTIGNGAAVEKFAIELARVLDNIRDPNTQATAKRKIVMEWVFEPDEDREKVITAISARAVFASTKPSGDVMFVGRQDGSTVATVMHGAAGPQDPRQGVLPIEQKAAKK